MNYPTISMVSDRSTHWPTAEAPPQFGDHLEHAGKGLSRTAVIETLGPDGVSDLIDQDLDTGLTLPSIPTRRASFIANIVNS
jgi:hypothetical protein